MLPDGPAAAAEAELAAASVILLSYGRGKEGVGLEKWGREKRKRGRGSVVEGRREREKSERKVRRRRQREFVWLVMGQDKEGEEKQCMDYFQVLLTHGKVTCIYTMTCFTCALGLRSEHYHMLELLFSL